jgi:hypothetical protein
MMKLTLGSKVCFDSGKHGIQVGTLIKFNQKTVSVLTEDGRRWKVSPQFLSPVIDEASSATNVIELKTNKYPWPAASQLLLRMTGYIAAADMVEKLEALLPWNLEVED